MFKLVLYPGVIFHELMHYLLCIILGVKVSGFKLGLNDAHVKHANTNALNIFLIATAPLFFGNLFAFLIISYAFAHLMQDIIIFVLINWIVVSIIYYSIPSTQDTKNIKSSVKSFLAGFWGKDIFSIIIGGMLWILLYVPLLIFVLIIDLFDNFDIARIVLMFFVYYFAYSFSWWIWL